MRRRQHREPSAPQTTGAPHFREPEIEQLGAALRQHDVAGLQIAMDDARAVRLVQRARDLNRVSSAPGSSGQARACSRLQPIGQRLAFEILHHQEVDTVLLADVVQRADVRMVQLRDGARFAIEALAQTRDRRQRAPAAP